MSQELEKEREQRAVMVGLLSWDLIYFIFFLTVFDFIKVAKLKGG